MNVVADVRELIGNTPIIELSKVFGKGSTRILAKMECCNPTSVKDRAACMMVTDAIKSGKITPETEVIEASSGNTAIAVASLGTIFGYKTKIFMSESCGQERIQILSAYGAKVVLTPADKHTKGARDRAKKYCKENPQTTFFLDQHNNPNNSRAHEITTGPEIWKQTNGKIDAIVVGLGTSGTFEGLARFLKSKNETIKIIGFEPASSPIYSGGKAGIHKLTGVGSGFVSDTFKRSRHLLDEIIAVKNDDAFETVRMIARREGILVGPTSGASVWVAGELSKRPEFAGKTIVCFMYDTGERYLSNPDLFPADNVEKME